jgi:IMP dehydrogenase
MTGTALVKDYMTKKVITVTPDTPNEEVTELMKVTGHDGFPVKTNGEVIGMVTAFDLLLKPWGIS